MSGSRGSNAQDLLRTSRRHLTFAECVVFPDVASKDPGRVRERYSLSEGMNSFTEMAVRVS
jgi:hypothetical protein